MIDLIIGPSLMNQSSSHHIEDIFEGMSLFETKRFNLTVFNLSETILSDRDISRLKKIVSVRKANCIFISDQNSILNFDEFDFTQSFSPEHIELYIKDSINELRHRRDLKNKYLEQSKQKRSLPFYILGALLVVEPLVKIIFLKIDTGFSFNKVFEVVTSIDDPFKLLEFWALFPLAGVALLKPAAISLFVFVTIQFYSIYSYINYESFTWPFVQENPHVSSALLLFLNIGILVFFLIPENRKPYIFKAKELFRKKKRMDCLLSATARIKSDLYEVEVLNLSESGAMISSVKKVSYGERIIICVGEFKLQGEVVRVSKLDDLYHYGILFKGKSSVAYNLLKKLEQEQTINSLA